MQQLLSVVKQTKLQTTGACGQAVILQILSVAAQASNMTHNHLRDGAFRYLDNTLHCEVNTFLQNWSQAFTIFVSGCQSDQSWQLVRGGGW